MTRMSDSMNSTVESANGMVGMSGQRSVEDMDAMKVTLDEMRDRIADFDDAVRPIRNYFYWEPHCLNITVCEGIRAAFDATDGVSKFSDNMAALQTDMTAMIGGMDQMVGGMGDMNAAVPADGRAVPADHHDGDHDAADSADHPQQVRRDDRADAADDRYGHCDG